MASVLLSVHIQYGLRISTETEAESSGRLAGGPSLGKLGMAEPWPSTQSAPVEPEFSARSRSQRNQRESRYQPRIQIVPLFDLRGLKGEVWFGNARLGGVVLRLALLRFMGTCATLFRRRIEVVGRLAGLAVGEEIAPNRLFGSIGTGHWSPSSMQP